MKIFKKCIPLACESVYCEFLCVFVNREIVLKTVRLERSALGWGEGCPIL